MPEIKLKLKSWNMVPQLPVTPRAPGIVSPGARPQWKKTLVIPVDTAVISSGIEAPSGGQEPQAISTKQKSR